MSLVPIVPNRPRAARTRPWLLAVLLGAPGALLLACGGEPPATPDVYQARGIVRQVGRGASPEVLIQHEAIADFRNQQGDTVGMESMAMPFPVADPALAANLAAGDRIAFTFEVRWQDGPPLRLTALEVLDADTRLSFERASEGAEETAGDPAAEPNGGEPATGTDDGVAEPDPTSPAPDAP